MIEETGEQVRARIEARDGRMKEQMEFDEIFGYQIAAVESVDVLGEEDVKHE